MVHRVTPAIPPANTVLSGPESGHSRSLIQQNYELNLFALFRIHRIHMFLGLPDPDPLVRGMDQDQDPAPDPDPSISKQKMKKNLDSYYFVTSFFKI
jgi:hypothetical protein